MTIHAGHPFADADPDPVRRLRGRLGGTVTLWTAGSEPGSGDAGRRAGLTVTSCLVANGVPARVLGLLDPDSDLADVVDRTGRVMVQLLAWSHRGLAEAFAGTAPAPGGPFRQARFVDTDWGPRLADASTWLGAEVESSLEVGWSRLVVATVAELVVGEDPDPLLHRRGRWLRVGQGD